MVCFGLSLYVIFCTRGLIRPEPTEVIYEIHPSKRNNYELYLIFNVLFISTKMAFEKKIQIKNKGY